MTRRQWEVAPETEGFERGRSVRRETSTRPPGAGGCCRRWPSAWACSATSCGVAAATTSCTASPTPTSRCRPCAWPWRATRLACLRRVARVPQPVLVAGVRGPDRRGCSDGPSSGSAYASRRPRSSSRTTRPQQLRRAGLRGELHRLPGLYAGPGPAAAGSERDERARPLRGASRSGQAAAGRGRGTRAGPRAARPGLHAVIVGDGPERARVLARIRQLGLDEAVRAPGFVERSELEALLGTGRVRAGALAPRGLRDGGASRRRPRARRRWSARRRTTPPRSWSSQVSTASSPPTPRREALAAAVLSVLDAGPALRESTAAWFERNRERLSMDESIAAVERIYRDSSRTESTNAS